MQKEKPEATPKTYVEKRLAELGVTHAQNLSSIKVEKGAAAADGEALPEKYKGRHPYFWRGINDGINILYTNLQGDYINYKAGSNRWAKRFYRWRINPAQVTGSQKYGQAAGSGVEIFLPPNIVEAYTQGEKMETLYAVEGEFKAWAGYMQGLYMIGLPSIHGFRLKAENDFHPTINELIRVCKPDNLVVLQDADALVPKWEKWDCEPEYDYNTREWKRGPEYDLGKRLNIFYSAVKNVREWGKRSVKDVYFCQVKQDELPEAKGLDDLLVKHRGNEKKVVKDLEKLSQAKIYFTCFNISQEGPEALRKYFLLNRNKDRVPGDFYRTFQEKLGEREFTFMGSKYKYSTLHEQLQLIKHGDSERFVRVGCDYFKIITKVEVVDGIEFTKTKLHPWKTGEITRDYVNKGFKNFFDTIGKYDDFTNVPCNTNEYQQVIHGNYNLYNRIEHVPEKGSWKTIRRFLGHIFGDKIDIGLDYFTLLYRRPTQILPILSLVSKERHTGKTTFLNFMCEMFGENATILGNDDITDRFNDDFAGKLIIGIDEGLIEKQATLEKIKSWSTSNKIQMNTKGVSRRRVPFFGKIIVTSNNTDSFISIEDEETRFFVLHIHSFEEYDPEFMSKLRNEIPAFLHELSTREIKHPNQSRAWFHHDLLRTEALEKVKSASKSWLLKELEEVISEQFMKLRFHTLCYTISEIIDLLNDNKAGIRFRKADVVKQLEGRMHLPRQLINYEFPQPFNEGEPRFCESRKGRVFVFYIEKFLDRESMEFIGYPEDHLSKINDQVDRTKTVVYPIGTSVGLDAKEEIGVYTPRENNDIEFP